MTRFKSFVSNDGCVMVRDTKDGSLHGWEDWKGFKAWTYDSEALSIAMTAFSLAKERFKGEEWNTNYAVECKKILEQLAKVYFAPIHPDKGDRAWRASEALKKLKRAVEKNTEPPKKKRKGRRTR